MVKETKYYEVLGVSRFDFMVNGFEHGINEGDGITGVRDSY